MSRSLRRAARFAAMATTVLAVSAPGAGAAGVQVGSSSWAWGNPLPQGNTINALAFTGQQGYAVGDFGTILSTPDGGSTWKGLSSGTFTSLSVVQTIDADSFFAGGGCVGRRSDDGGKTFTRVAFTPVESSCRQPLAAVAFVSPLIGYVVVADGTVLRTDNNGQSFAQKVAVPGTQAGGGGPLKVNDIHFLDASNGIAATSDGKLYRTADGANSWTVVNDTQRQVREILFFDAKNGVAVGDQSIFLATDDAGLTWTPRALAITPAQNLRTVSCATPKLCVMATGTNQLVRTTDGGLTGSLVAPSQSALNTAGFASATRVTALGAGGATAISDDAGATFVPVGGRLTGHYSAVVAGPANVAFATGDNGSLAKTTDGGATWTRSNVSTSEDVLDVTFPTATTGFALDTSGGLFRTTDGGATWRALDTGSTALAQAILATSETNVLVIGPRGIRRSTDGGDTFNAVSGAINKSSLSGVDKAGTALIAWGFRDVWRSTDKGKTWSAVRKPGKLTKLRNGKKVNQRSIVAADFVSAKVGYLATGDPEGGLYRTADAGKRWSFLAATGTGQTFGGGLSFSSAKQGYVVVGGRSANTGLGSNLLRTTDGGATFTPQFVVPGSIARRGIATGPNGTDYLLGGDANLLATTSGGIAGTPSKIAISTKQRRFTKLPATSVTVTGKISPAQAGDSVTVSHLLPGTKITWRHQTVKADASGKFTSSWRLSKGVNTFVAQWLGDFQSSGRGSTPLTITVTPKKK